MEIHGHDVIVPTETCLLTRLKSVVLKYWPNAIFEDDTLDPSLTEVFLHKDQASFDAWAKEGWNEENDLTMIYYLYSPERKQATFVIDDYSKNKFIVDEVTGGQ